VEWLNRMMDAIDRMERMMEERFDIEAVARAACSSPFHFQRMFHMITGMTVAEYVRKRKLTLAAQELASSSAKVLDVALKYGYDSPESFAKAFRRVHGIAPSEARQPGAPLKAFPRISFHLSLKGDQDMDYRIEDKGAFTVVGRTLRTSCQDNQQTRDISQFWGELTRDGTVERLEAIGPEGRTLGVCLDMQPGQGEMTYMVAAESSGSDELPDGWTSRTIAASSWAIFPVVGPIPGAITSAIGRIFQEWFPATGYEHAGGPEIEAYTAGDPTADDYRSEVWIPVVRK